MKPINIRIMSYSLRNFCLLNNLMFVKVLLVCIRYPQKYQDMWYRVLNKQTALENSFNLIPSPYFIISSTISWELLLFSHPFMSDSLRPHGLQHARPPCPSPSLGVCPSSCPLNWWCHPTISSSVAPSPLALSLSQHQGLLQWVSSSHQVAKVLELQLQHQSFQWIFWVGVL